MIFIMTLYIVHLFIEVEREREREREGDRERESSYNRGVSREIRLNLNSVQRSPTFQFKDVITVQYPPAPRLGAPPLPFYK